MNTDVEELLRDGMERFTAGVQAPAGLAHAATRLRRRRLAVRATVACGTAAVTAAAVVAVAAGAGGGPAQTGPTVSRVHTTAYVISRVERALAGQHLVLHGRVSGVWGPSNSWAYGPRHRFEEVTGSDCGHALPSGDCTHRGGSEPYLAVGTALIGGKLTGVYVTYYNHKWSQLPERPIPASACSTTGALGMGGPPIPTSDWPAFIRGCSESHRKEPAEARSLGESLSRVERRTRRGCAGLAAQQQSRDRADHRPAHNGTAR